MTNQKYWMFDANRMTVIPIEIRPGVSFSPPTHNNGVFIMAEGGLSFIMGSIASALQPEDGETLSDAAERLFALVSSTSDLQDIFNSIGFAVQGGGFADEPESEGMLNDQ